MNILHQNNEIKDECNCRSKKYFPLSGKCLPPNIVYQGKITYQTTMTTTTQPNYNEKVYFGVVYFGVAEKSILQPQNDTELSKEYWKIKRNKSNLEHRKRMSTI